MKKRCWNCKKEVKNRVFLCTKCLKLSIKTGKILTSKTGYIAGQTATGDATKYK